MTAPLFHRVAIIGLGLIGSSIARGVRAKHLAEAIVGCDPNEVSLALARQQNFIDTALKDPATAAAHCDLVILAAPPSTLSAIAQAIAPKLEKGALVMDTCSVKQSAIDAIAPYLPDYVEFIPAHPIAGSEQSGVRAGRADLFERKRVIVTPPEALETETLKRANNFWQGLGARVEAMPAPLHDLIYGYVSHLPQLLAFAAAPLTGSEADPRFLRLSHSAPAMWTEIFLLNKTNVLKALDRYLDAISHIRSELAHTDEPQQQEDDTPRNVLFPRIAASCVITTVMEAEKQVGFSFGRYAGTGFADFIAPASLPPDPDIERISGQHASVVALLEKYQEKLKAIRHALETEQTANILSSLRA